MSRDIFRDNDLCWGLNCVRFQQEAEQDTQYRYNVTLSHVLADIVAVEEQ
jgi:hypothetical protein